MRIQYQKNDLLPPMAWIAYVQNALTKVYCGSNVETLPDFFVEGAWNGSFEDGNFINSEWFCGTGGRVEKESIRFSTPTHVTSALFVAPVSKGGGGILVSNSLHLLCAFADYHLDPQYLNYETDFNTIVFGIHDYKNEIRLLNGKVLVYYFRNIKVSDDGKLSISIKDSMRPFTSFFDYQSRINECLNLQAKNAQDNRRQTIQYGIVTTVSKGYDAPCCAVLAKECGCETAVTFNAKKKYLNDSGVGIARQLCYKNIIERDADAFLHRTDLVEAEQIASGSLGSSLHFATFDDIFKNNLVFTGDRGDSIWARENPIVNDEFRFDDVLSHLGVGERRLWIGYISVPVPLFGASAWTSIQNISQSDEMKPWSIGNKYDRPIPRRICEQAGVLRDSFGISKSGAGFTYRYDNGRRVKKHMSETARRSFTEYVNNNAKPHPVELSKYLWQAKELYLRKFGIKIKTNKTKADYGQIGNATTVRYLFPWAGKIIQDRYRYILEHIK